MAFEILIFSSARSFARKYHKDEALAVDHRSKELLGLLKRDVAAVSVVDELLFVNLADGEIVCFGMGKHKARNAAVGAHGAILGEGDAYVREVQQLVDEEVDGLVG